MRSTRRKNKCGGTIPTPPPLPPTTKSIPLHDFKKYTLAVQRTRRTNKKFLATIAKMRESRRRAERKSGSSSSKKKGSSSHQNGGRKLKRTHKRK